MPTMAAKKPQETVCYFMLAVQVVRGVCVIRVYGQINTTRTGLTSNDKIDLYSKVVNQLF